MDITSEKKRKKHLHLNNMRIIYSRIPLPDLLLEGKTVKFQVIEWQFYYPIYCLIILQRPFVNVNMYTKT